MYVNILEIDTISCRKKSQLGICARILGLGKKITLVMAHRVKNILQVFCTNQIVKDHRRGPKWWW